MPIFVDTNVLVYARDRRDRDKHLKAQAWMAHLWDSREGRLSTQVLQEYYVTVTRKLRPGLSRAEASEDVRDLWTWEPVIVDLDVLEIGWAVEQLHQLSFWDALIVAAAGSIDCEVLLTEDLDQGSEIHGVTVVNPFTSEPGSLK